LNDETKLVGTPCPVPHCQGYVKYIIIDDNNVTDGFYTCDYGHDLKEAKKD
jgi:hypothetical protein